MFSSTHSILVHSFLKPSVVCNSISYPIHYSPSSYFCRFEPSYYYTSHLNQKEKKMPAKRKASAASAATAKQSKAKRNNPPTPSTITVADVKTGVASSPFSASASAAAAAASAAPLHNYSRWLLSESVRHNAIDAFRIEWAKGVAHKRDYDLSSTDGYYGADVEHAASQLLLHIARLFYMRELVISPGPPEVTIPIPFHTAGYRYDTQTKLFETISCATAIKRHGHSAPPPIPASTVDVSVLRAFLKFGGGSGAWVRDCDIKNPAQVLDPFGAPAERTKRSMPLQYVVNSLAELVWDRFLRVRDTPASQLPAAASRTLSTAIAAAALNRSKTNQLTKSMGLASATPSGSSARRLFVPPPVLQHRLDPRELGMRVLAICRDIEQRVSPPPRLMSGYRCDQMDCDNKGKLFSVEELADPNDPVGFDCRADSCRSSSAQMGYYIEPPAAVMSRTSVLAAAEERTRNLILSGCADLQKMARLLLVFVDAKPPSPSLSTPRANASLARARGLTRNRAEMAADKHFESLYLSHLPFDSALAVSRANQRVLPGFDRVSAAEKQLPSGSPKALSETAAAIEDAEVDVGVDHKDLPANVQKSLYDAVMDKIRTLKSAPTLTAKERAVLVKKQEYRDTVVMRLAWLELRVNCRLIPDSVRERYQTAIKYAEVRYGTARPPVAADSKSASAAAAASSEYNFDTLAAGVGTKAMTPGRLSEDLMDTLSDDLISHTGLSREPLVERKTASASSSAAAAASAPVDEADIAWEDDKPLTVQGQPISFSAIATQSQIDAMTDSEFAAYAAHAAKFPD